MSSIRASSGFCETPEGSFPFWNDEDLRESGPVSSAGSKPELRIPKLEPAVVVPSCGASVPTTPLCWGVDVSDGRSALLCCVVDAGVIVFGEDASETSLSSCGILWRFASPSR